MFSLRAACVAGLMLIAPPALANCQPPPPGLGIQDWYGLCTNEIAYAYRTANPFGLDYNSYVQALYAMYVQASTGGGIAGPALAGGKCSPDGQSVCNSSGWLLTCSSGIWITGAARC